MPRRKRGGDLASSAAKRRKQREHRINETEEEHEARLQNQRTRMSNLRSRKSGRLLRNAIPYKAPDTPVISTVTDVMQTTAPKSETLEDITIDQSLYAPTPYCSTYTSIDNSLEKASCLKRNYKGLLKAPGIPIVARVYAYLQNELEYMKTINGAGCDLSRLTDILKRTIEATGVTKETVINILDEQQHCGYLVESDQETERVPVKQEPYEVQAESQNEESLLNVYIKQELRDTDTPDRTYARVKTEPDDGCGLSNNDACSSETPDLALIYMRYGHDTHRQDDG